MTEPRLCLSGKRVKIIGDSIAAGIGSSSCRKTEDVVFTDGKAFHRHEAPESWWGLFARYLAENSYGCTVRNLGCGGANTTQILRHLPELVEEADEVVFVLMGLNDRKRENGLAECRANTAAVIDALRAMGKEVVLFTPTPSTEENEYFANRLHRTWEIVSILREVAAEKGVMLVDLYRFLTGYLAENGLRIEDIVLGGAGCKNDGLHPADAMQRLMFQYTVRALGLEERGGSGA